MLFYSIVIVGGWTSADEIMIIQSFLSQLYWAQRHPSPAGQPTLQHQQVSPSFNTILICIRLSGYYLFDDFQIIFFLVWLDTRLSACPSITWWPEFKSRLDPDLSLHVATVDWLLCRDIALAADFGVKKSILLPLPPSIPLNMFERKVGIIYTEHIYGHSCAWVDERSGGREEKRHRKKRMWKERQKFNLC